MKIIYTRSLIFAKRFHVFAKRMRPYDALWDPRSFEVLKTSHHTWTAYKIYSLNSIYHTLSFQFFFSSEARILIFPYLYIHLYSKKESVSGEHHPYWFHSISLICQKNGLAIFRANLSRFICTGSLIFYY